MKKQLLLTIIFVLISVSFLKAQTQPPVIIDDTFSVAAGSTFTFNPLSNDYDPDGYNIYVLWANYNSNNGRVIKHDDTSITVKFPYDAKGIDSLRYAIWDEQHTQSLPGHVVFKIWNNHAIDSLNINNVRADFAPFGNYFWNFIGRPLFEVPAGSGKGTVFTSIPWVGALDDVNVLHLAGETYRSKGADYFKGPVRNSQAYYMAGDSIWNHVWKISKAEIEYHKNHYWQSSYSIPEAIANWPAHGDTSLGEALYIAPFYDKDGDGVYNPKHGDYPIIKGDQSVFMIFNDAGIHTESGGLPLGLEFHVTAYAYDCQLDTAFDNTIFLHYVIYNRSGNNYHNVYFGLFTDFDIGYAYDDLMGCDPKRNSFFGYNGILTDGNGHPEAYGLHPPAQAVTFLSESMSTFMAFRNVGSGGIVDPIIPSGYYNYLSAWVNDTLHLTYGGDGTTGDSIVNFMFPSDPRDNTGWSAYNTPGYTPFDIRGVGSIDPFNLDADSSFTVDVAFIYARDMNGDHISSIALLKNRIDHIQWFYDHDSTACGGSFSGFSHEKSLKRSLKVYPVPARDFIWIERDNKSEKAEYEIYSISGERVMEGLLTDRVTQLNISKLQSGIYIIVSWNNTGIRRRKFIVE